MYRTVSSWKEIYADLLQNMPFLAIIQGCAGCGKSTLLNMIGTLETVDKGDIRIYGKPLPGINSRKATMLRRNTINYLFQSFALINDMTVFQNLLLSMHFLNLIVKAYFRWRLVLEKPD